jgi:hypothetical protein
MIDFKVKEKFKDVFKEEKILKQLKSLKRTEILVGIPEKRSKRRGKGQMNNATLMYIHSKGSAVNKLPPRPIIESALSDPANAARISKDLREIAIAALDGNLTKAKTLMKVTGQDAVNIVRDWFDNPSNGLMPDKSSTVAAKLRKLKKVTTAGERKEMLEDYNAGVGGINTTLVDTGQLRRAIDYVLNEDANR